MVCALLSALNEAHISQIVQDTHSALDLRTLESFGNTASRWPWSGDANGWESACSSWNIRCATLLTWTARAVTHYLQAECRMTAVRREMGEARAYLELGVATGVLAFMMCTYATQPCVAMVCALSSASNTTAGKPIVSNERDGRSTAGKLTVSIETVNILLTFSADTLDVQRAASVHVFLEPKAAGIELELSGDAGLAQCGSFTNTVPR